MASSRQNQNDVEVLETGHIYFVYRPRVEEKHAEAEQVDGEGQVEGLDDVQRFYMVLKPKGKKVYRMLAMGRKQLPDANQRGDQAWRSEERRVGKECRSRRWREHGKKKRRAEKWDEIMGGR